MKRRRKTVLIVLFFLPFAWCMSTTLLATVGLQFARSLSWGKPPPPRLEPEELLLPVDTFPDAWQAQPIVTGRKAMNYFMGQYDAAMREYLSPVKHEPIRSGISHAVARYRTEEDAHRNYLDLKKSCSGNLDSWPELQAWQFAPPHASEYCLDFALESQGGVQIGRAYFIARYERYISDLVVVAYTKDISPEQVKELFLAVDDTLAQVFIN